MRRGFTLIELMTGMAIVSALFALSITKYWYFQYKARRQEAYLNVDGIVLSQQMFHATFDRYAVGASNPGGAPGATLRDFQHSAPGWSDLGWRPDGKVRCNYETGDYDSGAWFRVEAACDFDRDNQPSILRWDSSRSSTPGWNDLYLDRF